MRRALPLAVAVVLGVVLVRAAGAPWTIALHRDRAERLYRRDEYREAYDAFRSLSDEMTRSRRTASLPIVQFDAGNSAYRLGRFADAVQGFRAGLAGSPALQEKSTYNLGNSYMWLARAESDRKGTLRAAIGAYEDALVLDPRDRDAKWNLEIALRRLEDEERKQGGGTHRDAANWGGGNLTKSGYAGAPQTGAGATPGGGYGAGSGEEPAREITETDARRLLEELERAQLSGQTVRRPMHSREPSRRKDW